MRRNLFGPRPKYTFCNQHDEANMCTFPDDIDETQKYDAIWFAGCNIIDYLFFDRNKTFSLMDRILKPDGYIFFTENENFVRSVGVKGKRKGKGKTQVTNLTMYISRLLKHMVRGEAVNDWTDGKHVAMNADEFIEDFKRHFIKNIDEYGYIKYYKKRMEGGKKRARKSRRLRRRKGGKSKTAKNKK